MCIKAYVSVFAVTFCGCKSEPVLVYGSFLLYVPVYVCLCVSDRVPVLLVSLVAVRIGLLFYVSLFPCLSMFACFGPNYFPMLLVSFHGCKNKPVVVRHSVSLSIVFLCLTASDYFLVFVVNFYGCKSEPVLVLLYFIVCVCVCVCL